MLKQSGLIKSFTGFLGSHLCNCLIQEEYDVIGMDNILSGSLSYIEYLFTLKEFSFYYHDFSNSNQALSLLDRFYILLALPDHLK